jgi:hypothetical protein
LAVNCIQLIVCSRIEASAKVVGSLAQAPANVLGIHGFVARAEPAGLAPGERAPVMVTSRADHNRARLVAYALAQLHEYWSNEGPRVGDQAAVAKAAE